LSKAPTEAQITELPDKVNEIINQHLPYILISFKPLITYS
jgi:hypothetical protein